MILPADAFDICWRPASIGLEPVSENPGDVCLSELVFVIFSENNATSHIRKRVHTFTESSNVGKRCSPMIAIDMSDVETLYLCCA